MCRRGSRSGTTGTSMCRPGSRATLDGASLCPDAGRLHRIGIGRTRARTHVLLLVQDLDIRVINAATGELLRALTLDPRATTSPPDGRTDPHPQPRPTASTPDPDVGSGCPRCLETQWWGRWDSNPHCQEPKSCASAYWATAPGDQVCTTEDLPPSELVP